MQPVRLRRLRNWRRSFDGFKRCRSTEANSRNVVGVEERAAEAGNANPMQFGAMNIGEEDALAACTADIDK